MNLAIKLLQLLSSRNIASLSFHTLSLFCALTLLIWYFSRLSDDSLLPQNYDFKSPSDYAHNDSDLLFTAPTSEAIAKFPKVVPYNAGMPNSAWDNNSVSSLSIILPVYPDTIPDMTSTLLLLLQEPSELTEVILVSAIDIHSNIRDIVRNLLTDMDSTVDFDISIQPFASIATSEIVLEVATQVNSEMVLILDASGLAHLRSRVVQTILNPPRLDLPMGPRVYNMDGDDFICFSSSEDQRPGFLVPPLVIPTNQLLDLDLSQDDSAYGIWAIIAEDIASFRPDHIAGIVTNLLSAGSSLCTSEHDHSTSNSTLSMLAQGLTPHPPVNSTNFKLIPDGTFAFVFPFYEDFAYLFPAICQLRTKGHTVYALISDAPHTQTTNPACDLEVSFISESSSLDEMGTSLSEWILALPSLPDVVITPEEEHGILIALDFVLKRYSSLSITRLQIPHSDLPFCDWMGSIGLEEWRNWHKPQLDITVITNDRPDSLKRLLKSLSNARLFGDTVNLRINIEQTADKETLRLAADFRWPHGTVTVHRRVIHGGLLPAVVESWYPVSNHSYGLILEDDVEISPLFYPWVKMSLLRYRYGSAKHRSQQLFGISLYQQKNLELRPEGRHRFSARLTFAASSLPNPNTPYLSQIPCSWGAVYFPEHWQQFHEYLSLRLSNSLSALPINTIVAPAVRSNKWTRSWKKYFIEMAYLRGYVMLYPNYPDYLSLSTNHLEVGSHVKDMPLEVYHQKQKLFLLPLLQLPEIVGPGEVVTGLLDLPEGTMPLWHELPTLDLLGLVTDEKALKNRGALRVLEIFGCDSKRRNVESLHVPRWLCA